MTYSYPLHFFLLERERERRRYPEQKVLKSQEFPGMCCLEYYRDTDSRTDIVVHKILVKYKLD